ncbi:MAG: S49 family peptidase [Chlamydiae bacterium]|nr:S49 family peptidase [Chlamydiota bacterium]
MQMGQESIFVSAIRSFCKMFFAMCGLFLAFFLFSFVYSSLSGASLIETKTTMSILPDAEGKRDIVSATSPAILQINLHGIVGANDPSAGFNAEEIENILLDSHLTLLAKDRVKGILIHMNSPGGTVADADAIYEMLKEYKTKYHVPIFTYVSDLCASGGMYIASATDRIYTSPVAIVGSVGVIIGPFFNVVEALGKIGVQAKTLTEGLNKDMMSPFRPWKEGESASLQAIMSNYYHRFVDIVTTARPKLSKEKLLQQYGAQVFDAKTAEEYGYVDQAGVNRNEALLALLQEAKIDPTKPYQVVQLEPRRNFFSEFVKGKAGFLNGKVEHSLDLGQPKISGQFAYLYQPE